MRHSNLGGMDGLALGRFSKEITKNSPIRSDIIKQLMASQIRQKKGKGKLSRTLTSRKDYDTTEEMNSVQSGDMMGTHNFSVVEVGKIIDKKMAESSTLITKTYNDAILALKAHVQKLTSGLNENCSKTAELSTQMETFRLKEELLKRDLELEKSLRLELETKLKVYSEEIEKLKEKSLKKEEKSKSLKEKVECNEKKMERLTERISEMAIKYKLEREGSKDVSCSLANIQMKLAALENSVQGLLPLKLMLKQVNSNMQGLKKEYEVAILRVEDLQSKLTSIPTVPQTSSRRLSVAQPNFFQAQQKSTKRFDSLKPTEIESLMRVFKSIEQRKTDDKKVKETPGTSSKKTKDRVKKTTTRTNSSQSSQRRKKVMKYEEPTKEESKVAGDLCRRKEPNQITKILEQCYFMKKKEVSIIHPVKDASNYHVDISKPSSDDEESSRFSNNSRLRAKSSEHSGSVTFLVDEECYLVDKAGNYIVDDHGEKIHLNSGMIAD